MNAIKCKKRRKDKADRATIERVLDNRTIRIIDKLAARSKLFEFSGCISTGKEANIYTCRVCTNLNCKMVSSEEEAVVRGAIKIYQTSIMEFKSRIRYIDGEPRFKTFCTTNPRKLVKLWAEKEVRNLKRLNKAEIPSPMPIYLKNNVLIMTLIGDEECVAPRLRDAKIETPDEVYGQCVDIITRMYKIACLIHADLSEYNLLYYKRTVFVIDVGQSVEISHKNGHDFLIMDIRNINNFFQRLGVNVLSPNAIFENVTGTRLPHCLKDIELVQGAFIPTNLDSIANIEDASNFVVGEEGKNKPSVFVKKVAKESVTTREEMRVLLKENKKKVKESNRLRRITKVPKKEKERLKRIRNRGKKR